MQPVVRINFRDPIPEDLPYILDSWRQNWRLSERCRRLRGPEYRAYFGSVVTDGLLQDPDTRLLVGASQTDPTWIWSWLCYTPGPVVTVHFGSVRREIRVEGGSQPLPLRRIGLFTRMVAAAGVRDDLVYTFQPSERTNRNSKRNLGVERGLISAAGNAGISVVYRSVEDFLGRRRNR